MRLRMMAAVVASVAVSSGCYRATIDTGRTPSGQKIEQQWAHSFLGGLVPPKVVETAQGCPNGVAKVTTQHSFLNMVAAGLTGGLYSPMTVTVECANAGGGDDNTLTVAANASMEEKSTLFNGAVQLSRESGEAVLIRFE